MREPGQDAGGPWLSQAQGRVVNDREAGQAGRGEEGPAEHPSFAALERLARGGSPAAEKRRIVHHLLTGCPGCCARLRALRLGPAPPPGELEAAIERAIGRVQELVASAAVARERFARLLALPPEQQLAAVTTDEFCDPGICRLLLIETEEAMRCAPARGLRLGRIAAAMARRLAARDPERFGELRSEARQRLTDGVRLLSRWRQVAATADPPEEAWGAPA